MNSFGSMSWRSGLIPMIEPEAMAEILSSVTDLGLVIAPTGQILGVLISPNYQPDLTDWPKTLLQSKLTVESIPKLEARLKQFSEDHPNVPPVELNHKVEDSNVDIPVRYSFHKISNDKNILMLGRDLRPIVDMQQQLVAAQVALEQDYEVQRGHETKFRVLMQAVPDAMVFVSSTTGTIQDCNAASEAVFGRARDALIGVSLSRELKEPDYLDRLLAAGMEKSKPITLSLKRNGERYTVTPTLFRAVDENGILCHITPFGVDASKTDALQQNLNHFYETGVDAIVFTSVTGQVLSANEAFLKLASVTQAQSLKGRSVSEFLSRGTVDLKVILENTIRTGSIRLYSTKVKGEHGTERSVEISSSALGAGDETVFALLIRDTNRMEAARPSGGGSNSEVDMRSVIELIGSQSLKTIVARTTDVVEKMCIETAVEMTSNNRVAAAEMLGLSRQSLYVKLRKYGLLER